MSEFRVLKLKEVILHSYSSISGSHLSSFWVGDSNWNYPTTLTFGIVAVKFRVGKYTQPTTTVHVDEVHIK